jgi:PAS domain S-box-containing protein
MRLYSKIFLILSLFFILSSLAISYYGFTNEREIIQQGIDEKLLSIVYIIKDTLPPDYHDLIMDENFITNEDYNQLVSRYNRTCSELGLKYVWSLLEIDGRLVFTSSTSPDHKVALDNHAHFFEEHTNPEVYEYVLSSGETQFKTSTDKWGEIRAVLVPYKDIHGRTFIFGASVEESYLKNLIRDALIQFLLMGFVLIILGAVLSYFLAQLAAGPLERLLKKTSEISNGELNDKIPHLDVFGSYEEQTLLTSFNKMGDSISRHIYNLNRTRENLRMTLHSIGDGVIVVDLDGCIININSAASKLIGWDEEDVIGKAISYVFNIHNFHTNQIVKNPVYKVLETKNIVKLDNNTIMTARDGTQYHISDSAAPIVNGEEGIIGVILVFSDISEEFELQEQLKQSQKMEAIGQLAGGIAHDFNNMICGIYGGIELLKPYINENKDSLSYLDLIHDSASRAADLTKNLLIFSRKQSVPSTALDVHPLLNNTIGILSSTLDKKIKVELFTEAEQSFVAGDASQLQSIFLNLGINASHAMPQGGSLIFRTGTVKLNHDDCESSHFALSPGNYISIEIIDNGCGMRPEVQSKIFDPFFTTKGVGEGSGLGLSMAYGSIVQHKGMISVNSQLDKGTVFQILLPVVESHGAESSESLEKVRGSGHLLLVDDESAMRVTGSALLKDLGYSVTTVENGKDAIEFVSDLKNKCDLVILDMNMPHMDGYECFYGLKKIRKNLPVIISSGLPQKDNIDKMKKDGLIGYIQKPFHIDKLSQIISKIILK